MLRRSLFFILTVVTLCALGYQAAWHPELFGDGLGLLRSGGALLAFGLGIAFLIWGWFQPAGWKTLAAFGLGILAAWASAPLWGAITWATIGWVIGALIVLAILWMGTTMAHPIQTLNRLGGRLFRAAPTPPTTPTP